MGRIWLKRLAVLATLAAVPFGAHGAAPAWTEFKAPDGSFSIAFPGLPRLSKQKLIFDGKIASAQTFAVNQMSAIYAVTILEARASDHLSEKDVLSMGTSADGARTISDNNADVDGHLTRDMLLQRGPVWEQIHVVVAGQRVYRVSAMMREDYSKKPETIRYFDSFMLMAK